MKAFLWAAFCLWCACPVAGEPDSVFDGAHVAPEASAPAALATQEGLLPKFPLELKEHAFGGHSIVYSPDGSRLLTRSGYSFVVEWDPNTLLPIRTFKIHAPVYSATYSDDGSKIIAVSDDFAVVWSARSGRKLKTLKHEGLQGAALSPDGSRAATGGADGKVILWNTRSGKPLKTLEGADPKYWSYSVSFSPDGSKLAAINESNVLIWDIRTGEIVCKLENGRGPGFVRFSPDGRFALTRSYSVALLWDARTGAMLRAFKGHSDDIQAGAFSPDGSKIATGGDDGTVILWDVASGKALMTLDGQSIGVTGVAFSADGSRVATATKHKTGKIWQIALNPSEIVGLDKKLSEPVRGELDSALDGETAEKRYKLSRN